MRFKHGVVITGIIGSGKSTASSFLAKRGYSVICADSIAHELLDQNASKIAQLFGEHLLSGGRVDRKALGAAVFADKGVKERLESLLHPLIYKRICKTCAELEKAAELYFVDIPLFFESGGKAKYDFSASLLVYAPKKLCLERIIKRNNISQNEANARILAQMDIEQKRELADFVLENTGDLASLERALDDILEKIKSSLGMSIAHS